MPRHSASNFAICKTGIGTIDSAGDLVKKGRFRHGPIYEAYCRFEGLSLKNLPTNLPIEEVSSLRGAFMLLRKDAFLNAGGFDNTFVFNYEDVDLGLVNDLCRVQVTFCFLCQSIA